MSDLLSSFFLIAIGAFLGHYIKFYFDKIKDGNDKKEIARLTKNEFIAFRKHTELNLEKLNSLSRFSSLGDILDYEKLRYIANGFRVIKTKEAFMLKDKLAQDVLRMELFSRNTELEINRAIDIIFNIGGVPDKDKKNALEKLIEREGRTLYYLLMIIENLDCYLANPKLYEDIGIDWDVKDFQCKPE